jgi:23S rRNA pseudouridine2604 synthase
MTNSNDSSKPEDKKIRLSKLMSEKGLASRREADTMIERGYVYVNGIQITELGTKVFPTDNITLSAEALQKQKQLMTIILNKPIGYVSSQPEPGYEPAIRLIQPENQFIGVENVKTKYQRLKMGDLKNIAVTGRLDIDSQGLLILTQDGRLAKKIIGEDSQIEKEYLVRVQYEGKGQPQSVFPPDQLKLLNFGLSIDGEKLKPAKVDWVNEDQLRFVLNEGKKRQIRRMCEQVGLYVVGLKRVRVGKLMLGKLPEGKWRFLDPTESI